MAASLIRSRGSEGPSGGAAIGLFPDDEEEGADDEDEDEDDNGNDDDEPDEGEEGGGDDDDDAEEEARACFASSNANFKALSSSAQCLSPSSYHCIATLGRSLAHRALPRRI